MILPCFCERTLTDIQMWAPFLETESELEADKSLPISKKLQSTLRLVINYKNILHL